MNTDPGEPREPSQRASTDPSEVAETIAVRAAHRFDRAALQAYLQAELPEVTGPLEIRQFSGGQSNPTFLLQTPERRYVLRKKPPGQLLPSAHSIEREYRVMKALASSPVPVPPVVLLCEDSSVIGTPFYVMRFVEGRVFRDLSLPDIASPAERGAIYDAMVRTLAALHGIGYAAAGLADYGKPSQYMARQIARWSKQYELSKTQSIDSMESLSRWLPEHLPQDDETCLAHGDFRLENLLFHPTEPRVLAVLDWELSTLGHPLADLAYNCAPYYLGTDVMGRALVSQDLAQLGIPTRERYVSRYAELSGRESIPDLDTFVAFSLFRYAAIIQGVYKRGTDGNASSERATSLQPLVAAVADVAWRLVADR